MIIDELPTYDLVTRWLNFSNALAQVVSDAQGVCDVIDSLKSMAGYDETASEAEKDYHDALKAYCVQFIGNVPSIGV